MIEIINSEQTTEENVSTTTTVEPTEEPSEIVINSDSQKKVIGRKFILSAITSAIGALVVIANVFAHGDSFVSVIALIVALLSTLSYVITEGKIDMESVKKTIVITEELIKKIAELKDELDKDKTDSEEDTTSGENSEEESSDDK